MQKQSSGASLSSVRGKSSKVVSIPKGVTSPTKVENKIITSEQLNTLKGLRYKSGNVIIDPDNSIGLDIYYEVLSRIKNSDFNAVYSYLTSKVWIDEDDVYFNLPEFKNAEYRYNKYIESYHDEREMIGGLYKCKFCKSNNTNTAEKQTRRGDEGATVRVFCLDCGRNWGLGGS